MKLARYVAAVAITGCVAVLAGAAFSANVAPTERAPGGGFLFDKCPRESALLRRPEVLEEALAALWRKLPVVFYNVTWANGKHGAINHKTASVGAAVMAGPGGGDSGKFYRAAVPLCGSAVARNTWAFKVAFGNTQAANRAGWVAFLSRSKDGWHLYGAVDQYSVR